MGTSFKYWDDCVDPEDMKALWKDPEVSKEWLDAGETKGKKVHLSRDPDGQPYLTQTEMEAVAWIVVERHFKGQIDLDMLRAIAEIASDRQPLAMQYYKKTKEAKLGLMQVLPNTAEWLSGEMGYRRYDLEGNPELLYRPFISVYFAAAYIKWLSGFDGIELQTLESPSVLPDAHGSRVHVSSGTGNASKYWDIRVSPEDMEELWKHVDVLKEWTKSGERRGKVRFSLDSEKKPYLSRVEVKAVAEIILSRHFSTKGARPSVLCALAEFSSMRFVNGAGPHVGIMGIDYPTAFWLYKDAGYKAYVVNSVDDLCNPFASMYFGAAYLAWLSKYEGRERTDQFIVQAYLKGPENVNLQVTGPLWTKFQETICYYEDKKKELGQCSIL